MDSNLTPVPSSYEIFNQMLRGSAAKNGTIKHLFSQSYSEWKEPGEIYQRFLEKHQNLLQQDKSYQQSFEQFKKSYFKMDELMTKGQENIPPYSPHNSSLTEWKGIAMSAFHVVRLAARAPYYITLAAQEISLTNKMFKTCQSSFNTQTPA